MFFKEKYKTKYNLYEVFTDKKHKVIYREVSKKEAFAHLENLTKNFKGRKYRLEAIYTGV